MQIPEPFHRFPQQRAQLARKVGGAKFRVNARDFLREELKPPADLTIGPYAVGNITFDTPVPAYPAVDALAVRAENTYPPAPVVRAPRRAPGVILAEQEGRLRKKGVASYNPPNYAVGVPGQASAGPFHGQAFPAHLFGAPPVPVALPVALGGPAILNPAQIAHLQQILGNPPPRRRGRGGACPLTFTPEMCANRERCIMKVKKRQRGNAQHPYNVYAICSASIGRAKRARVR